MKHKKPKVPKNWVKISHDPTTTTNKESGDTFTNNRVKIKQLESDVSELKFCVYALMFLNTMLLMAMAFS